MNDNNTGINVFSFDPGGYVVKAGDELVISEVIDQFNGLLEIIPESLVLLSSGNALNDPRNVTEVTEVDESSYLYTDLLGVDSVANISASGYTIYTTHENGNIVQVRVDSDAHIQLEPEDIVPGAWLQVFGVGTQFDNSFPFTSGYQLLAFEFYDIIDGVEVLEVQTVSLSPNPACDMIQLKSDLQILVIEIYSLDG